MLATPAIIVAAIGLGLGALGPIVFDLDVLAHFRAHFTALAFFAFSLFAVRGRLKFAFGALAISVFGAVALWPAWRSVATPAAPGCETERITIAAANLLIANRTPRLAEEALLDLDADIVVTLETSEAFYLSAVGLQAGYPHRAERLRRVSRTYGAVIWSRLPLEDARADPARSGAPIHAIATVLVGEARIGLAGLHFSWPLLGPQHSQIAGLSTLLAELPEHRVLIGDFNAAPWSHALQDVERLSGARLVGGFRLTWRGRYPGPSAALRIPEPVGQQIDHALASPGVGVVALETFDVPGSDHDGLLLTIDAPAGAC